MTDHITDVAQGCVNSRLAEFFKWAMREGPWEGDDLDGGSVQDKAESLGLIVKTKYDPAVHGPAADWMFEAGDDYYTFAPELAAQPPAAPAAQGTLDREKVYAILYKQLDLSEEVIIELAERGNLGKVTDAILALASHLVMKSAPVLGPSQNTAERLPSSDAAGAGADTAAQPPVAPAAQPAALLSVIEAEARRIAGMYPQSSDGRNTFVIFADWISNLAAQPPAAPHSSELGPADPACKQCHGSGRRYYFEPIAGSCICECRQPPAAPVETEATAIKIAYERFPEDGLGAARYAFVEGWKVATRQRSSAENAVAKDRVRHIVRNLASVNMTEVVAERQARRITDALEAAGLIAGAPQRSADSDAALKLADQIEAARDLHRNAIASDLRRRHSILMDLLAGHVDLIISALRNTRAQPQQSAGNAQDLLELAHRIERCNPTHMVGAHTRPFLYRQDIEAIVSALRHVASAQPQSLSDIISTIPADLNWLIGKGKTRPDEPPYGVQLLRGLKVVAETEGDDLRETIKAAVSLAMTRPHGGVDNG